MKHLPLLLALALTVIACDSGLHESTATLADGDAALAATEKVEICHLTGLETSPVVLMHVPQASTPGHWAHGDFPAVDGSCNPEVCPADPCPCFTATDLVFESFECASISETLASLGSGASFPFSVRTVEIYDCFGPQSGETRLEISPEEAAACRELVVAVAENRNLEACSD